MTKVMFLLHRRDGISREQFLREWSGDQILSDFPDLTRDDIRACLAFAVARERRLTNSVA